MAPGRNVTRARAHPKRMERDGAGGWSRSAGGCPMPIAISCRELGMDCHFACEGETEDAVIESLVAHFRTDHAEDWFEIEEFYATACAVVRTKAA